MVYMIPILLLLIAGALYYLFGPARPLSDAEVSSQLHNKVVLICGASSGIGEELAYKLAGFGAKLVLVARNQENLDAVRAGVLKLGASEEDVRTISFDFSNVNESGKVIDKTIEWFGKLDYLVSNHGAIINGPFLLLPYQQDPDFLNRIFRVNVLSHIELAVKALPHLEATNGHMFFTSSMAGEVPFYNYSVYCSTKHATNGFFYSLQQELIAKESRVSLTIGAFGPIKTKAMALLQQLENESMVPDRLAGDLNEVAHGIAQAYVTRPTRMTYPKITVNFLRMNWALRSTRNYHENLIGKLKAPGANGTGYQDAADKIKRRAGIRKQLKYQQGYVPGDEN